VFDPCFIGGYLLGIENLVSHLRSYCNRIGSIPEAPPDYLEHRIRQEWQRTSCRSAAPFPTCLLYCSRQTSSKIEFMNRETNVSDGRERREPEVPSSASQSPSGSPGGSPSGSETKADAQRTDHGTGSQQFIAVLKRGLEQTRLPANLREQILAELPPPEEQERLFREMQEKGGMSFDQLMESLGLEVHPQP
jgi:hypothetical protein